MLIGTRTVQIGGEDFEAPILMYGALVCLYPARDSKHIVCLCLACDKVCMKLRHTLTDRPGGHRTCGCRSRFFFSSLREYRIWRGMLSRCNDPGDNRYEDYGERGIKVCERWQSSFLYFLDDMGLAPSLEYSIDRINNDGNYEPGNCRWATRVEQQNNTRKNRFIEYDGRTQTVAQWAVEYGINRKTLTSRLRLGYTIGEALAGRRNQEMVR